MLFGVSNSYHLPSIQRDPTIYPFTCYFPQLLDSKIPLSISNSKMNLLRDWRRSGLFCPRSHTSRKWYLWDEVIEIQIEKYILKELSLKCPFPLWLICAKEAEHMWLPCLLWQDPVVSGSECPQWLHSGLFSEPGTQRGCPLSVGFPGHLSVTFILPVDLRNYIRMEDLSP